MTVNILMNLVRWSFFSAIFVKP